MDQNRNMHNVIAARDYTTKDGDKRTVWTQIGIAFPARDGSGGFDCQLYYMPVPQSEGMIRIQIRPPMEPRDGRREMRGKGGRRERDGSPSAPMGSPDAGDMDDIPY